MSYKVKICGLTNAVDLAWVCKCKADYAGMLVEIPKSARSNTLEQAVELSGLSTLPVAAVTLNAEYELLQKIDEQMQPHAIQLHGNESAAFVEKLKRIVHPQLWKVIHLPARSENQNTDLSSVINQMKDYQYAGINAFLIDTMVVVKGETHLGGTGKTSDWGAVTAIQKQIEIPVILAGGITPENVVDAIKAVKPYAVDVSSGVELSKAKKDPDKVLSLITKVRSMDTVPGSTT